MQRLHPAIVLTAVVLTACGQRDTPPAASQRIAIAPLASPTHPGAAEPFLSADKSGKLAMSWLERQPDSSTVLYVATRAGTTWSAPHAVVKRTDLFVNWADFPSVVRLASGRLLAHWLQRNGGGKYAYDVRLASSDDEGATWSVPATPHAEGAAAEHGFVTLLPGADSAADIFFLNGDVAPPAPAGGHEGHGPPMRLGFARWGASGTVVPAINLDTRICDCCQTAAARTTKGPIVLYRGRSENETRDIGVLRVVNGAWTEPARLHEDNWTIDACPVNGPAVAASGDTVAAVWFTAARDTARVQLKFSTDAGATFSAPVRIDGGAPVGRVDVELLANGDALVTWLERTGEKTADVRARIVRPDGTAEPAVTVSSGSNSRAAGFPRMTRVGRDVVLAWTQAGDSSAVRMATLRVADR